MIPGEEASQGARQAAAAGVCWGERTENRSAPGAKSWVGRGRTSPRFRVRAVEHGPKEAFRGRTAFLLCLSLTEAMHYSLLSDWKVEHMQNPSSFCPLSPTPGCQHGVGLGRRSCIVSALSLLAFLGLPLDNKGALSGQALPAGGPGGSERLKGGTSTRKPLCGRTSNHFSNQLSP